MKVRKLDTHAQSICFSKVLLVRYRFPQSKINLLLYFFLANDGSLSITRMAAIIDYSWVNRSQTTRCTDIPPQDLQGEHDASDLVWEWAWCKREHEIEKTSKSATLMIDKHYHNSLSKVIDIEIRSLLRKKSACRARERSRM